MKHSTFLLVFFLLLFSDIYAQPPARLKKVLVSRYTTNVNAYAPWDSTVYYYSGNNRGYLNNEIFFNGTGQDVYGVSNPRVYFYGDISPNLVFSAEMQYDSAIKYRLGLNGSPKFVAVIQEIKNSKIIKLTTGYHNYLSNKWHHYWVSSFSYLAGRIISQADSGKNAPGIISYNYFYSSTGALDSVILTMPNGKKQKITYTYNNGMPVERINYSGNGITYKTLSSYQANGLLTGLLMLSYDSVLTVWDTTGGIDRLYNTSSQLIHEKRWGDSGKTWLTIDIAYDNNNNRVEDIIHCDYYQNGQNTGLIKIAKKQYGYNSFGLISNFEVVHWDDSSQTWELGADSLFGTSQKVQLEYEAYWPQDVSTVSTAKAGLTIFPSPASGFITVKADEMPTGDLEAIIYDMQGRVLRRWADKSDGIYLRTIPVQELPVGNYILQLNGKEITRREQFVIY
jgi:hypothetical protein